MNNKEKEFVEIIDKTIENAKHIKFENLQGHNIIFIVDMINGFAKHGILSSPNINNIIKPIKIMLNKIKNNETKIIAFNDAHNEHSPEFNSFPTHCLEDSDESQLVKELQTFDIKIIKKNSTNGFFAFDFKPNLQWDNIIIVGCCTDICVYQLALSCKTWFNQHNKEVNVIVPISMTNTFDNEEHPAHFINKISFFSMIKNGINVVKDIV